MAGYDPVIATFEATTASAIAAVADYEAALVELEATFGRVAEASGVLDERLAVTERGFQSAAVESNMLSSELTGLEERLGAAGGSAKTLASGMSNISKSAASVATGLDDSASAIVEFASRVDSVDEQLSIFNGRLALLGDGVITLGSRFASAGTEILRSLASINDEIAATVAAMNEAAASTAAFAAAQTKAASATKTVSAEAAASTTSLKDITSTLAMVGGAFDLVDFAALKTAGTFQANMNRLQTEAGLSTDRINAFAGSMSGLEGQVLAVGNATGFAGTEISNALYEPVSAGLSLSDALQTVKMAAEEAQISGASLGDTTTGLTAVMKNFGSELASPEQGIADLNAIVGQGMMRFQDFDASIKTWAPTAATFGVSLNSAGAALAYMTDRGESAQTAGTKLAQVMAMMVGQTTQAGNLMGALGLSEADVATANQAMTGAMDAAHVTTSRLADDLRSPDGITVALNDLESHMKSAGMSTDQIDSTLVRAFGGGRQFKGLAELIENTDQLQQKFDQISHDSNIDHFQQQWDTVSKSFSVQWDQMTASLKNFAIAIGTNLMPIGAQIAGVFSGIFKVLSENKQLTQALATAMGVLAVALPIGALVGFVSKLSDAGKAVLGVSTNLAMLSAGFTYGIANINTFSGQIVLGLTALSALGQAAKVLGGTDGLLAGISGAIGNAGAAIRTWVAEIGEAEGAMATASAIGGGLVDFLASPWGIALGVAATAIGVFVSSSDSAAQSMDGLTAALDEDSGAIGTNTAKWISNKLEQNGALKAAQALGISSSEVATALVTQGSSLDSLKSKLQNIIGAQRGASDSARSLHAPSSQNINDAQALLDALNSLGGGMKNQVDSYNRQKDATDGATQALQKQASQASGTTAANMLLEQSTKQVADSLSAAKQAATDLQNALDLLNGGNIDAEKANLAFKDSIDTMTKSLHSGKNATDDNTDAGRANIKTILDAVSAAEAHAEAVAKQTGKVQDGNRAFQDDIAVLQGVLAKAGFTKDQINDLTKAYMQMPPLHLDSSSLDSASKKVQTLTALVNGIPTTKQVTVSVDYQRGGVSTMSATGGKISAFASGGDVQHFDYGGGVSGMGTESSDSIPALLSDNEYVIRARVADQVGTSVLDALNTGDLDTVYRLLGQRSDVHAGASTVDMGQLAGLLAGPAGQQQPVVVVNITPQGSILAENDLRALIQQTVLRYAGRNNGPGWTGAFT